MTRLSDRFFCFLCITPVGNSKALHLLQLPEAAWSTTTLVARMITLPRTRFSPLALRLGNRVVAHSKKESFSPLCLVQSSCRHVASSVLYLPTTTYSKATAIVSGHITYTLLQLPGKCMSRQDCGIFVLAEVGVVPLSFIPPEKQKRDR